MRIAIFGGSFNPVHSEHINIVKAAKRDLSADKVIIIPSNITPKKTGKMSIPVEHRLNALKIAFEGCGGVEISDCEISRGGISYSYVTCRELKEKYPKDELFFVVGADMFENFSEWKYPEEILKCVNLAVCARENEQSVKSEEIKFNNRFNAPAAKINYTGAKVSSTRIRVLAALGESLDGLVPEKEEDYIKAHSLYLLPQVAKVKDMLRPERWQHTVRVAVMAAENCSRAGVSELTAVTAAALHDCAKYIGLNDARLKGFTLPPDVPEPVIHQFTGAYIAEKVFGISDEQILNAIRYHTTGRADMGELEKLIFLSDMLEEGRSFEGVDNLRAEFSNGLDNGMRAALEHSVSYLNATGKPVYPLTQAALNYFKR